jgi:hypothetical protein
MGRRDRTVVRVAALLWALLSAAPAHAQWGLAVRGFVYGIPPGGVLVPGDITIAATVFVPTDRSSRFLPVPVIFPAGGVAARTADTAAPSFQTRIFNGQLLDLHVLPEPGGWTVRVVRDVPTLRVSGGVLELRDGSGTSTARLDGGVTDCLDPRECAVIGTNGRIVLNLGPWAGDVVLNIETGYGTAMTSVFAGCDYDMDVVAVQGRLFATHVGPTRIPCRLYPPYGMSVRGWLFGLAGPTPLPPPAPLPAALAAPLDRGASAAFFPAGLPATMEDVRTLDVRRVGDTFQFETVVRNGDLLEMMLLPDGGTSNAWVVRDVATLKLTGRIVDVWDGSGTPVQQLSGVGAGRGLCFDPRGGCEGVGADGRLAIDLGSPSANAVVPIDVAIGTAPFSICRDMVVEVEVAIRDGRMVATRFLRAGGGSCFFEPI